MDADLTLVQSDCQRAYTQAKFDGPPTFVRLPKKWRPEHWHGKFKNPVCRLDYALYGHPKAGDIWGDRLEEVLVDERGFTCVEGWPSVYVKHFNATVGSGTGSAAASLALARPGVLLIILRASPLADGPFGY